MCFGYIRRSVWHKPLIEDKKRTLKRLLLVCFFRRISGTPFMISHYLLLQLSASIVSIWISHSRTAHINTSDHIIKYIDQMVYFFFLLFFLFLFIGVSCVFTAVAWLREARLYNMICIIRWYFSGSSVKSINIRNRPFLLTVIAPSSKAFYNRQLLSMACCGTETAVYGPIRGGSKQWKWDATDRARIYLWPGWWDQRATCKHNKTGSSVDDVRSRRNE